MPNVQPSRERAHLTVAAIRVLGHRLGQPPRPGDVAQLLGWTVEETLAIIRGLADAEILQLHETPFEIRMDIRDHLKVESLPLEADKAALRGEVDEFKRKSRQRKEELDRLFGSAERDQKKQQELDNLDKEFEEFRKKTRRTEE